MDKSRMQIEGGMRRHSSGISIVGEASTLICTRLADSDWER
jgi:hypothetical protein